MGATFTTSSSGIVLASVGDNPVSIASGVTIAAATGPAVQSATDNFATGNFWTIGNSGTVTATGNDTASVGILLAGGGGALANKSAGRISGYTSGVSIAGAGTVINQGRIASTGTAVSVYDYTGGVFTAFSAGVILGAGGVDNAASAVISSYFQGVVVGGGGSVSNAGTIQASSSGAGFGVVLAAGGLLTNAATGTISSNLYGAVAIGASVSATVANNGTIAGRETAVQMVGSHVATVVNAGLLSGANSTGVQTNSIAHIDNKAGGRIAGGKYGVYMFDTASTVTNAGTIAGVSVVGAVLLNGGTIDNKASGSISGAIHGIFTDGTVASTVVNSGVVSAISQAGIMLAAGGVVTNNAGGGISALNYGVFVANAAGTVTNAGSIASSATFSGAGVRLAGGGSVANSAGGDISARWIGVQIGGYTTASVSGTIVNQGRIFASDGTNGAAVWIHGPGSIYNGPTGQILGGPYGIVAYYATTVVNKGTISGTQFAFDAVNPGFANRIVAAPGAVFQGLVAGGNALGSTIVSTLELTGGASTGTISGFGTQFTGFGHILIDDGASWALGGTVAAQQVIELAGDNVSLTLLNPGAEAGTIVGFSAHDTLVLSGVTDVTGLTLSGNVLNVGLSSGPGLSFILDAPNTFAFATSSGGTSITVACFAEGVQIETASGPVAVEALRVGMEIPSIFGGSQPAIWIGKRTVDCACHPRPEFVWPVEIAAGAFGGDVPHTTLRLSPDHAVHVDGVLAPIRLLVNGVSIRQVPVDRITYYHVELPQHDVVRAEGLPVESYLDVGDRSNYANGAEVALFPDFFARKWEMQGCAPLALTDAQLDPIRRKLAAFVRRKRVSRAA